MQFTRSPSPGSLEGHSAGAPPAPGLLLPGITAAAFALAARSAAAFALGCAGVSLDAVAVAVVPAHIEVVRLMPCDRDADLVSCADHSGLGLCDLEGHSGACPGYDELVPRVRGGLREHPGIVCGFDCAVQYELASLSPELRGGHVLDVSRSSYIFGPGKPRHVYAGRAVTRAATLQSVRPQDIEAGDDTRDFDAAQRATMQQRISFFLGRYPKVGVLVGAGADVDVDGTIESDWEAMTRE